MTAKIFVLHEHNEWTVHLQNRLEELSLPYELWHLDEGHFDLSSEPPKGVFYSRISASSHTRDHRFAPEYAEAVLVWLERHRRTVINGSRALRLEVSKVNQYMALNESGIATPKTLAAVGRKNILRAAKELGAASFITKHNRAGKGQGVQLFHSIEALQGYLNGPDFDEPVDVVEFESFTGFRQRVTAMVGGDGVSWAKTSDGAPHLILGDVLNGIV